MLGTILLRLGGMVCVAWPDMALSPAPATPTSGSLLRLQYIIAGVLQLVHGSVY